MTQEQQDIDLGYELFNRASPKGYFHITRAGAEAFGRAARELMGEKRVATREDVPSVEEIKKAMMSDPNASIGGLNTFSTWARIAHDMMLKLAPPRKRMKIDGMTIAEIADSMRTRGVAHSLGAAENAHYLANTPAEDAPDPDAAAKRLADLAARVTNNHPDTKTLKQLIPDWSRMNEAGRDGWRAVAAKMGERG